MASLFDIQRETILAKIRSITAGDWKILVLDEYTKRIINNVLSEDDILRQNIASIEMLEQRRDMSPDTDAIYIIHPQDHVADCVVNDVQRRRYRHMILVWTAPPGEVLDKIRSTGARLEIENLPLDFFPRESNLATFRDKRSFLILFHPICDRMVSEHIFVLARRIAAVCISLGEHPMIRYYSPKSSHDAAVLCYHLSRFVDDELIKFRKSRPDWPPPSNRAPSLLVVTDRSMDLKAPLVHEFTYQAMAHDLLDIKDEDNVTFRIKINEGRQDEEEKDAEITEKDPVWLDTRHRHMKDTIDKLKTDFQKFLDDNPQFKEDSKATLSSIRDMVGGLPHFTLTKDAYSLHLTMAQECMAKFQGNKLNDVGLAEQNLAVGLDEDGNKPKQTLEAVVRLLDDPDILKADRLRLILLWILYRDGVIPQDVTRLLAHAELPIEESACIDALTNLGFKNKTDLKEQRQPTVPLFSPKAEPLGEEIIALSRYETALASLIDSICKATVDSNFFPFIHPLQDASQDPMVQAGAGASLRAGGNQPRWARGGRTRQVDNRQRLLVFMAGGATHSESRVCYEMSQQHNKDIYLITSHMITPRDYVDSLRHLSWQDRRLDDLVRTPKPPRPPVLSEPPLRQQVPPSMQPGIGPGGRPGGIPPTGSGGGRIAPRPGGLPSRPMVPPAQQMERMNLGNGGGAEQQQQQQQRPASSGNTDAPSKEKDKKKKRWFKP